MRILAGLLVTLFCSLTLVKAQNFIDEDNNEQSLQLNTITTAVPFLLIGPDARHGAMGDVGVATTPDASSMHWNPAKYAFVEDDFGFAVCYTPWLRALIPDITLSYLSGYFRRNDNESFGFALRYFSLGDITFTDNNGYAYGQYSPNEFALSSTYARKLHDNFSTAIALRFINSNLTGGVDVANQATQAGRSIAADIATYYVKEVLFAGKDLDIAAGMNISNMGNKIAYTETTETDFIPINMRMGSSVSTSFDEYNALSFSVDFNKLLVPTPDSTGTNSDVSVVSGIFQSFGDAPGGAKEEFSEVNYSIGAEYWYDQQFAVRTGYFHEAPNKGDRRYFTMGAGVKYNVFRLDFSYLFPVMRRDASGATNPLANTLRFSLVFDFGAFEEQVKTPL